MANVKVVFFLPVCDNDGRELTAEREAVEDDLFLIFIGWTFLGMVQGAYRMTDGTRSIDEHRAYAVMTDDSQISEIEEILRRFKAKTTQEAIYLELQYNTEMRLIRLEEHSHDRARTNRTGDSRPPDRGPIVERI